MFFGDSFFKDSWQDFQEAVRDVVVKCGDPACPADDLTHYRTLRQRDLRDENQAMRFTEDEVAYKVSERGEKGGGGYLSRGTPEHW